MQDLTPAFRVQSGKCVNARPDPGFAPEYATLPCRNQDLTPELLYMPGLVARRHNPLLKVFADRLAATGLAPKAVIGAVMRKLTHLVYGVITSGKPFDQNYQSGLAIQDGI
jgi:hypothetical protein